ncbi:hypothetical protein DOTSEDRAFT_68193 [Dothistroma septosporum NZE10]|uniref:Uncharacterized protein n=1 Tax=Dothistroma septosporum (strain NZE10 / CBS 128990) TaxID=675120 RepID=N1Q0Y0_DOTSN|nr:hypothetical protein DOTSEDRAFT_68193 [Dothistroma septosporum NZE10]
MDWQPTGVPNLPADAFQVSSASQPMSPALFAEAIKELPLDTLYAKAAELQNSISHLLDSNIQMKPFADEGDADCKEAIEENDVVIKRFEERIELCKKEAENRGLGWSAHGSNTEEVPEANGHAEEVVMGSASVMEREAPQTGQLRGLLTDEEIRRQMDALVGEDEEDGVHL